LKNLINRDRNNKNNLSKKKVQNITRVYNDNLQNYKLFKR